MTATSTVSRPAPQPARMSRPIAGTAALPRRRARGLPRRLAVDLLVAALWGSAAIALALYLATPGLIDLGSLSGVLEAGGIATGLVGTDFVLVMLLLAARVPWIDRTIGYDRAIAVHAALGKPAFLLIVAHGGLLLLSWAASSGAGVLTELGTMLGVDDLLLAVLGLLAMTAVVGTSLVAARRRLSHEVWQGIHLLSYVAIGLSIPHQFSQSSVLMQGTAQSAYWTVLLVLVGAALVLYRVIEPIAVTLRHRLRVDAVERIAPDAVAITLRGRHVTELAARGGQFFVWRFFAAGVWWRAHPFSLSAAPGTDTLRITVRIAGRGTEALSRVRVGTAVGIAGPYGLFTDRARTAPRLAVIAAGIGITPALAMLQSSALAPGEATVLLRARSAAEAFHTDELQQTAARTGTRVYASIGARPSAGEPGPSWLSAVDARRGVTMRSIVEHPATTDLYICGPDAWARAVTAEARAIGVPAHRIHSERFAL